MKHFNVSEPMGRVLLVLFLFVAGTLRAADKATVVIKMTPNKEFVYWFSGLDYLSDSEQGFARSEKAKTDSAGLYVQEFAIDKPVTLNLGGVNHTIMTILPVHLTSGSRDTITIEQGVIRFQGTNADYNRCLHETESFMDYCNQLIIAKPSKDPLFQTKSLPEFTTLLTDRKTKAIEQVKLHPQLGGAFADELLAHIELGSRVAFMFKVLFNVPDSLQTDDWKQALKEVVNKPIDTPYFRSFREVYFVLSGLLSLDYKMENGDLVGMRRSSFDSFERLAKHLKGENLECAWATLINDDITHRTYNPIVPELYDTLKERFPNNTYQSFLEAGIQENSRFNTANVTDSSNKDYQIISCDSSFHSLADAIQSLKGKVVYVDLWATWCGSCLSEFPYLPQVEKSVKDLEVAFVYVSLDRLENKARWEKSIRYYKLKGHHLLATPELAKAIYKEFGNYIPHAIIFDKDGNLVERNAPGLKQRDKLCQKLTELCGIRSDR